MKIATVKEFRDHATQMFRETEPILILRYAEVAGIFFPHSGRSLPVRLRNGIYEALLGELRRWLRRPVDRKLVGEFLEWSRRRAARRRR